MPFALLSVMDFHQCIGQLFLLSGVMKMPHAVESGSLTNPRINGKNFGRRLEEYIL